MADENRRLSPTAIAALVGGFVAACAVVIALGFALGFPKHGVAGGMVMVSFGLGCLRLFHGAPRREEA